MFPRLLLGFLAAVAVLLLGEALEEPKATADYRTDNDWKDGLVGNFTLTNPGSTAVADWRLYFDYPGQITNIWGGEIEDHQGTRYSIKAKDWNQHIPKGGKVVVGFESKPGGNVPQRVYLGTTFLGTPKSAAAPPSDQDIDSFLPAQPFRPPASVLPVVEAAGVKAWFTVRDDWGTGLRAEVTVQNQTWHLLRNWVLYLDYPRGITRVYGAQLTSEVASKHRIDAPLYGPNAVILPRGVIRFSLLVQPGGQAVAPNRIVFRAIESGAEKAAFNYAEALQKSLYFFEAQRSGKLPATNRVAWRGDSALQDGAEVGKDLTGGYYDAGDHVKFALPLCSSLTLLAWGGIEYCEGYERSGQWSELLDTVRWGTDWILKAHTAPNELYAQIGDGVRDHAYWGPPELMRMSRPAYKIDTNAPGSDLAGEASAALASASILFKKSDPDYAAKLLEHAKQLFAFADQYRAKYSDSVPAVRTFYPSSGYLDELAWAAAWLYCATGEADYLARAESIYQQHLKGTLYTRTLSWDDKSYGVAVLLARITKKEVYRNEVESFLDYWSVGLEKQRVTYTAGGLAWLGDWGALRYAANTAFLAFIYSDAVKDYQNTYHLFARHQINYILGANPAARSYVVGFGRNPPLNPHHRAAHGSTDGLIDLPTNNLHVLYGALVGGPSHPDDFAFYDDRRNLNTNEVALDYNAAFTGALARMVMLFGGYPLRDFPPAEILPSPSPSPSP